MKILKHAFALPLMLFWVLLMGQVEYVRADWRQELANALKNGGAYAVDEQNRELFSYRANEKFIPASTLKVATIFAAIEILGPEYRFPTEFYLGHKKSLQVKGYGDPLLISEELERISEQIAGSTREINDILLDDSYFSDHLSLDGSEGSSNPYDAQNGALIANFNTVVIRRLKNGDYVSGEPQTPTVPMISKLRKLRKGGEERFNLGNNRNLAVTYVGELLKAFLERRGVKVKGSVRRGQIESDAKLLFTHACPKTLAELSQHILEYSTNFGANQIFLALGARRLSAPATYEKGSQVVSEFLRAKAGITDFVLVEGSGLSRRNQFRPVDLVRLMQVFRKHEYLLPLKEGKYRSKTGSLTGVNSLTGYMDVPGKGRVTFAFVVNSAVPFRYKYRLAEMLAQGISS